MEDRRKGTVWNLRGVALQPGCPRRWAEPLTGMWEPDHRPVIWLQPFLVTLVLPLFPFGVMVAWEVVISFILACLSFWPLWICREEIGVCQVTAVLYRPGTGQRSVSFLLGGRGFLWVWPWGFPGGQKRCGGPWLTELTYWGRETWIKCARTHIHTAR